MYLAWSTSYHLTPPLLLLYYFFTIPFHIPTCASVSPSSPSTYLLSFSLLYCFLLFNSSVTSSPLYLCIAIFPLPPTPSPFPLPPTPSPFPPPLPSLIPSSSSFSHPHFSHLLLPLHSFISLIFFSSSPLFSSSSFLFSFFSSSATFSLSLLSSSSYARTGR